MNILAVIENRPEDLDVSDASLCSEALMVAVQRNHVECARVLATNSYVKSLEKSLIVATKNGFSDMVGVLAPHCRPETIDEARHYISNGDAPTFVALLPYLKINHQELLYRMCVLNQQAFVDVLVPYCDIRKAQQDLKYLPDALLMLAQPLADLERAEISAQLDDKQHSKHQRKM